MTITARRALVAGGSSGPAVSQMKQAEQGVHGAINTCATKRTQRRRSKK